MKERITVTLESDILRQVDLSVDGYTIKNRSHAIEVLLCKALGKDKAGTALILAGGRLNRLKGTLTNISPVMALVKNKPILEHNIDLLKRYGVKEMIIWINPRSQDVKDYFGDGSRFGVSITYLDEGEPLGTGAPLKKARPFLKETFIVCNGDELKDVNIDDLMRFHRDKKANVTLALTTVQDPSKYGAANLHGDRVIDFTEKPKKGTHSSNLINAGIYICEPKVIDLIPDGHVGMEKDIFPLIAKDKKLFGFSFCGQWYDCGNQEGYEKALKEWKG
ncbi:hypothetical protein JW968_02715 [Candidatus Woesearchaeota archaeon]|nr:hypothetical protein [Candidatus Woesearchaeota archaeon]